MNCSGGGSAALAVGRRYGLIPVVLKNEDCNPKSCFFVKNENFKEMKKQLTSYQNLIKFNILNYREKIKKSQKKIQVNFTIENCIGYLKK